YLEAAAVGLVGATLEDATAGSRKDKPLFDIGEAIERVAAAVETTRKLGFPFLLTARAEGFLSDNTDLDDAVKRLQAYEKVGAEVLMAPGLPDLASVKVVRAAISKPFNFMAGIPGKSFSVAELEAAGVRRISLAGSLYRAAMSELLAAAREAKDKGTSGYVDTSLPSAELAGFMRGGSVGHVPAPIQGAIYWLIATASWGAMFPVMAGAPLRIAPFTFTSLRYLIAGAAPWGS